MNFYFPDLSIYPKACCEEEQGMVLVAVGWLEKGHTFPKGKLSQDDIEKLEQFCLKPMIQTLGKRDCPLCDKRGPVKMIISTGKELILHGTDQLRILSTDRTKVYVVPNLIIHFVKAHGYTPPQEFIDAIQAAPLPGTRAYDEFSLPWKDFH